MPSKHMSKVMAAGRTSASNRYGFQVVIKMLTDHRMVCVYKWFMMAFHAQVSAEFTAERLGV